MFHRALRIRLECSSRALSRQALRRKRPCGGERATARPTNSFPSRNTWANTLTSHSHDRPAPQAYARLLSAAPVYHTPANAPTTPPTAHTQQLFVCPSRILRPSTRSRKPMKAPARSPQRSPRTISTSVSNVRTHSRLGPHALPRRQYLHMHSLQPPKILRPSTQLALALSLALSLPTFRRTRANTMQSAMDARH